MEKKNLALADNVAAVLQDDYVLISTAQGKLRRLSVENFIASINSGNEQLLRQVAWGVEVNTNDGTSNTTLLGNSAMLQQYINSCGRYLVTNDGKAAKLATHDSTLYADGTTLDETKGHIMVYMPQLYCLVRKNSATKHTEAWFSQMPLGGKILPATCVAAYKGATVSAKLVSRTQLKPTTGKYITQYWQLAQANGTNWGIMNFHAWTKLAFLFNAYYKSRNSQKKIGYGVAGSKECTESVKNLTTGATAALGDQSGKVAITRTNGADCSRISLFGVEDIYGWLWEYLQGIVFDFSVADTSQEESECLMYVHSHNKIYNGVGPEQEEIEDGDLPADCDYDYLQYCSKTGSTDFISTINTYTSPGWPCPLVSALEGEGSDGDYCDQAGISFYDDTVPVIGGCYDNGLKCGIYCQSNYISPGYCSARLQYYGQLSFVNGSEI